MIIHRARRDIRRCRERYGEAWKEYERTVPYLFVPVSWSRVCRRLICADANDSVCVVCFLKSIVKSDLVLVSMGAYCRSRRVESRAYLSNSIIERI